MGDAYTDNDFAIKKMLISLASGGTDEAQTSSLTKISIKQLSNRLHRKVI